MTKIFPDAADWGACIRVLEHLHRHPDDSPERARIERLSANLYKRTRKERRRADARERQIQDRAILARVLAHREGQDAPHVPAEARTVHAPLSCYICDRRYEVVDERYHRLCPECAAFNEEKRQQRIDLRGRRALVTGGRIKIGFETALLLLRGGAEVVVTTRRPDDAWPAFARAPDFEAFRGRLQIVPLDLRDLAAVEAFADGFPHRIGSLDILVNNAAQSVVRVSGTEDATEDFRETNSWTLRLHEVPREEVRDVFTVNAAAPLLMTGRLKAALRASPHDGRCVVNVVGLDGQFRQSFKSPRHPHVNASKAALHMMTQTCAAEWLEEGIHMCSVDPGWVTHEGSHSSRLRALAEGFPPPLDAVDGAARIQDPIALALSGKSISGALFKDYRPIAAPQ